MRCQMYAKTEDHIEFKLYFNSRHPRQLFSAQQDLFLLLNGPQIEKKKKKKKKVCSLKGAITNWSDIIFLLKLCKLQEERLNGWKIK